jgi:thiol-disulfide isomerase/thioredoxin
MSRPGRQIINTKASAPLAQRRNAIVIGSLVLLALIVIVAISRLSTVPQAATVPNVAASPLVVGQKAPDFSVSTTSGPFTLSKSGSKPTLLEVFASWCPHCQREVKVIDPLYAAYKDKVNFVAVNGDARGLDGSSPETQADVVGWAQKFGVTYPVAFDPDLDVAHKYLQSGFPTLVLIGADGTIQAVRDGEIPAADLKNVLQAAATGKRPNPKMGLKG